MGGLGPGIGGLEYLVIAAVALIVVGPERLPGMLRQLGKWVAKMRGMANEFRASFDEMARQSELDDLRKEVEALRTGQGAIGQGMVRLGAEADAAFKDIKTELDKPAIPAATPPVALNSPEFPEPAMTPLSSPETAPAQPQAAPKPRKRRAAGTQADVAKTLPESPATPARKAAATPKRKAAVTRSGAAVTAKPATPKAAKLRTPKTPGSAA